MCCSPAVFLYYLGWKVGLSSAGMVNYYHLPRQVSSCLPLVMHLDGKYHKFEVSIIDKHYNWANISSKLTTLWCHVNRVWYHEWQPSMTDGFTCSQMSHWLSSCRPTGKDTWPERPTKKEEPSSKNIYQQSSKYRLIHLNCMYLLHILLLYMHLVQL